MEKERQLNTTKNYTPEELKEEALKSLYFFNRYILGFNAGNPVYKVGMEEKPHREMCDFVQDWSSGKKKKLVVIPRYSLKTSCITIGYTLWSLAHDSSMTIILDSVLRALSITFLNQIRTICESNELFKVVFGEWESGRNWTGYHLNIKNKPPGRDMNYSIATAGVDSIKVSYHPKLFVLDDPVDRETVRTPEALRKTIRHYLDLTPMLGKEGRIVMPLTRWDQDDLVSYILENETDEWDILIRSAINDDGTAYYKEMLPLEWIQKQLEKDPYFASCQFLNEPINPATTTFNRDDIEWYEDEKDLPQLTNYITVDPAGHEGSVGDKTGILPGGVDKLQNLYFYEPYFDRLKPDEIIDVIMREYIYRKVRKVGIEENYYRGTLAKSFERRGTEWGTRVRVERLKHYGRRQRKEDRINALQPWVRDGKVFLKGKKITYMDGQTKKERWVPVGKNMKILYQQIISYPRAKMSDDLIDGAAMFLEIIKPSGGLDRDKVRKTQPVDAMFGY